MMQLCGGVGAMAVTVVVAVTTRRSCNFCNGSDSESSIGATGAGRTGWLPLTMTSDPTSAAALAALGTGTGRSARSAVMDVPIGVRTVVLVNVEAVALK